MVGIVESKRLLQRKQVLGAVATSERLLDRLNAGVATIMAQARQHLGVTFAGEDGADNPHAGGAGDVGNDVVKLEVHLRQRLLHVLNM